MFPEKDDTARLFFELFRIYPEHQKKKVEWKKNKKGKISRSKDIRKQKIECLNEAPPEIEIAGNASSFAVYATVRLAVLERWMKEACELYLVSAGTAPITSQNSDSEDEVSQIQVPAPPVIPKIVGFGLRSVFELIRESRVSDPLLCSKALLALLDVVQGHQPEALKTEPAGVVDPLLELLLDLATLHPGDRPDNSGLTAVACSCLLALVCARGDTGKILSAVATLLMCPRPIANQTIQMPSILGALQKSVQGVVLGRTLTPDWLTHGIPTNSLLFSFNIDRWANSESTKMVEKAIASDGLYLYIHTNRGLFKVGTGYGGTVKGYIYSHKKDFYNEKQGWMGYAQNRLLFRLGRLDRVELMTIDRTTLEAKELGKLEVPGVMFSDGEALGLVTPMKDDGFSIRCFNPILSPLSFVSELPLKLVQKSVVAFGSVAFDDETSMHTINTGFDDEIESIASGKEFSLIRTASGKVLFSGKGSSVGMKSWSGGSGVGGGGRWSELAVGKVQRVVHIALGHDGLHAILVADDGTAYFTGTARRGEDADHNKVRRQPKAVKPKKITKVEGHYIVYAACNNGTTALVSKEGELYMFGKDTVHCDPSTGLVNDLKNVCVVQVALGKAHAVAVTNKGHLYSFGINNKGQCGREFAVSAKDGGVVAMETQCEDEGAGGGMDEDEWEDAGMCPPGAHKWRQQLCMVCTVCRECTGYSISCLSSMRPDRAPGQECGCGEGDSGCSECGCCRICARENLDNSEMAILGPSGTSDIAGMMRLDLIFGGFYSRRQGSRLQDHLQLRLEERKQRQRAKLAGKHSPLKMKTTTRSKPLIQAAAAAAKAQPSSHQPVSSNLLGRLVFSFLLFTFPHHFK